MKVLIAYDGTASSDAAIVDLRRAGLPGEAEALVLTVAESPAAVAAVPYGALMAGPAMYVPETLDDQIPHGDALGDAQSLATQAAARLAADFPRWRVTTEAWVDAAAPAIIRKAHGWRPDLVVVGSHGRSGIRRFVLGSVSNNVLRHVGCSVRISRHHLHPQDRPIRLLIGVDGSSNAESAVRAVAARQWPAGTEARAVGVMDSRIAVAAACTPEGVMPTDIEEECRGRLARAVNDSAEELAKAGLAASHQIIPGKPCEVLLAEAESWGADCVFIGTSSLNRLTRVLHGDVCATVGSRARCSVEVIR